MADLKPAKAGDPISERARRAWRELYDRHDHFPLPEVVGPWVDDQKTPGQWICIHCGEAFQNNVGAHGHATPTRERKSKRAPGGVSGCASPRFAWRRDGNVEQGPKEIPEDLR